VALNLPLPPSSLGTVLVGWGQRFIDAMQAWASGIETRLNTVTTTTTTATASEADPARPFLDVSNGSANYTLPDEAMNKRVYITNAHDGGVAVTLPTSYSGSWIELVYSTTGFPARDYTVSCGTNGSAGQVVVPGGGVFLTANGQGGWLGHLLDPGSAGARTE
jgi:hypothetical protein